ncbi:MAG: hypothetical protein COW59_13350 [Lysobacterales bacterium CG17_big_fil_post_rev_8_21_14_2_50_64_11]|nr:MAG: hypothetical protein COW59_13350 [Xanthomonadales bacterium CG17_big_fil_post_rev_8_21_14_2_50_64_11]PIX60786.1 MAG: hypothetical protein COZ47_05365 [Xanthomonadales bacterium CG_4_10_14_3_um_filter_64_11]
MSTASPSHFRVAAQAIATIYNRQDITALYAKFDQLARIQITQQQLSDQISRLHNLIGDVDEIAYSHAELAGTKDGRTFYNLHYKVTLVSGPFKQATLKLSVVKADAGYSLFGFFLNGLDQ